MTENESRPKTLEECWMEYRSIFGPHISPAKEAALNNAFYAGAIHLYRLAGTEGVDEDTVVAELNAHIAMMRMRRDHMDLQLFRDTPGEAGEGGHG